MENIEDYLPTPTALLHCFGPEQVHSFGVKLVELAEKDVQQALEEAAKDNATI